MIDKYSNPMQSKAQQRANPSHLAPSKLKFSEQSNLQSPKFRQYNPFVFNTSPTNTDDYINQTPAFQDKYSNRAAHFMYEDQSNERYMIDGENYSQTQAKSQVISIKELDDQFQPSFMNNINYNLKRNFKKLLQKKIQNDVDELRTIQSDFFAFVKEQRNVVMDFAGVIGKQMEMSIKKMKNSQQTTNNAELMQEIIEKKKNIITLEAALAQKNQENIKLKKEVNDQKQLMEKQMKKVHSKKSVAESIESSYCSSCKISEIKQATLKEELAKTEKQIESLLIQNEKLQEYIFDIEQKIVGIDIEVERRLKEHLKILEQNKANAEPRPDIDKEDYVEIMRKLNDQNTALQNKCNLLEKNNIKEHDLRQLQKVLYEQQVEYRRKQTELFESLAKHETDKERLYQRQHNVALREEEITKRKEELQKKEAELNSLEEMINSQAEKIFSQTSVPSVERYPDFKKDSPRVNEPTINTFGKIHEKNANATGVGKTSKYERIYSQNVFIPELPLTEEETGFQKHEDKPSKEPHWQSITSPKSNNLSKQKSNELYTNILKKHEKGSKRSLHLASNITRNSPSHFQQTGMNSRMTNNKPILINTYLQNSAVTQERTRERSQTSHLGSKLDKLRSQIKRQIESIK